MGPTLFCVMSGVRLSAFFYSLGWGVYTTKDQTVVGDELGEPLLDTYGGTAYMYMLAIRL